jgi:hypothetical protein
MAAGATTLYLNTITITPVNGVFPDVTLQLTSVGPSYSASLAPQSRPVGMFFAMLAPGILGLVSLTAGRKKRTLKYVGLVLLLAVVALSMTACGVDNKNLPTQSTTNTGTPAGTYTATIQATSSAVLPASPSVTKTMQLTLTVK